MKTLITPLQVLKTAFGDGEIRPPPTIAEADIAAAEQRWIVPVIGRKLHDRLLAGVYPDLVTDCLAAPTALYTRALVQARLDVRTDRLGTAARRRTRSAIRNTSPMKTGRPAARSRAASSCRTTAADLPAPAPRRRPRRSKAAVF